MQAAVATCADTTRCSDTLYAATPVHATISVYVFASHPSPSTKKSQTTDQRAAPNRRNTNTAYSSPGPLISFVVVTIELADMYLYAVQ